MVGNNLVFEYFFEIGAGAAAGAVSIIIPARLIYLFILNKMSRKGAME